METRDRARALMVRHHQLVKNRERCMVSRAAMELGIPGEVANLIVEPKGEMSSAQLATYGHSQVGLS